MPGTTAPGMGPTPSAQPWAPVVHRREQFEPVYIFAMENIGINPFLAKSNTHPKGIDTPSWRFSGMKYKENSRV